MQIDNYTAVQIVEGNIRASQQERLEAFQHLVNTGLVWRLRGELVGMAKDLIAAWPASKVSATVPRSEERLASLDRRVPVQVNLSVHAAPTSVPAWNAGLTPAQSVAAWNTYLAAQHGSGG